MDETVTVSGYCRALNGVRMVCVEWENGKAFVDCSFAEGCPHRASCDIARKLRDVLARNSPAENA